MMDIFQELPVDQWPYLRDKLKIQWPQNVGGYYALDVNFKHSSLRDAFQFKVYCPYGDMNNGFITTSNKGKEEYMVFPINSETDKLEEAIIKTKVINWSSSVIVGMATSQVIRLMENVKQKVDLEVFNVWGAKVFHLDKHTRPFNEVQCPPETYLTAVDQSHINQVDEAWPYRYPNSESYFSTLISNGLSYGLYSSDKKLVAWIFINEYNSLCHLYCETGHRRKGYADFLLQTVVNILLNRGEDVYGFVVPENVKAMELFSKLGFQMIDDGAWINVCRKNV